MDRIVLANCNYIDTQTGKLLEGQTLILEGKKIKWIGPEGSFEKNQSDKNWILVENLCYLA